MPYCSVNLPPDLDEFVFSRVESGKYSNPTELMQAALRALDREERGEKADRRSPSRAKSENDIDSIRKADVFRKLWQSQFQSSPETTGPESKSSESC
jgi:putative addiction module CopG family antidote